MFILYIIAGLLLGLGILLLTARIRFIKRGSITEATVVNCNIVKNTDESDTLLVTFTFKTLNNEEATFTMEFGANDNWLPGDKATIVYNTNDPQYYDRYSIVFLTYWGSFGIVTVLFSLALVLILIAAGYYRAELFFASLT